MPHPQELHRLAMCLKGEDLESASQSAEELVDILLVRERGTTDTRVQDELGNNEDLREGLVHLLENGNADGLYWGCVAMSYLVHRNAANNKLMGRTPNVFLGLRRALGEGGCNEVACSVLSQLAFCNKDNSEAIADTEGLLESLVDAMKNEPRMGQQAAACALSNCTANSAKVALRVASIPSMIDSLTVLCREHTSACSETSRLGVSAIGCLDNLSFYDAVRPVLRAKGVVATLLPIVHSPARGERPMVMAAESAMIIARLTPTKELPTLRVPPAVVKTIVHCLRCAVDGEQWANFAWRLGDVLEPLWRLAHSAVHRDVLARCGCVRELLRALQLTRGGGGGFTGRCLEHCVQALVMLTERRGGMRELRSAIVDKVDVGGEGGGAQGVEAWRGGLLSAREILASVEGDTSGTVDRGLWVFRDRVLAVGMGAHSLRSPLSMLDLGVLGEVLERAFSTQNAIDELLLRMDDDASLQASPVGAAGAC